jgi:hypothetical protein
MQTSLIADPYRDSELSREQRISAIRQAPFGKRELLGVLGVLALFDTAFYNYGGLGQAIGLLGMPIVLFASARQRIHSARLFVLCSFALLLALRSLYLPSVYVTMVGFVVIAAIAQVIRVKGLRVPEFAQALVVVHFKVVRRVRAFAKGVNGALNLSSFWSKLATVVLPLVLVSAFAGVLSLANPVLAAAITNVFRWLAFYFPSPWRMAMWALCFIPALLLLRPSALRPKSMREDAASDQEAKPFALSIARNSLLGLNVLFLAHNVTEASQLIAFRAPAGMSTQDYAHAGAFWLTLALMMVNATIGLFFRDCLAVDPRAKLARVFGYGVLAQSFVLAGFTFERMAIHVSHTGLSNLRIVGFLGASLIVFAMSLITYKLARAKTFTFLLRRQLEAFAACCVLFAVLPTHLVSARLNVTRLQQGELGPVVHLFAQSQSEESAAVLLPLLDHTDDRIRHGVRALILKEAKRLEADVQKQRASGLLAWNFASANTLRTLQPALAAHQEAFPACTGIPARAEAYVNKNAQQCAVDALLGIARDDDRE